MRVMKGISPIKVRRKSIPSKGSSQHELPKPGLHSACSEANGMEGRKNEGIGFKVKLGKAGKKRMSRSFHHYTHSFTLLSIYSMENSSRDGNTRTITCLLRSLYADEEATVRTGHGTTDRFPNWEKSMSRLYMVTLLI